MSKKKKKNDIKSHVKVKGPGKIIRGLLKYRFNGDNGCHFVEGIDASIAAIPNKKGTKGIVVFRSIKKDDDAQFMIYDTDEKAIVCKFATDGNTHYIDDTVYYTKDSRVEDEVWSMRIKGTSTGKDLKKIPIAKFMTKFPEFNLVKGSYQSLTEEQFNWCKKQLLSK